jgi:Cys-rich protein (TIGR01571 family)
MDREWMEGLFELNHHWSSSICALFFPCVCVAMHVYTITKIGEKIYFVMPRTILIPIIGCAYNRGKFRDYYNINGDFFADALIWYCFPCCAASQEYREYLKRNSRIGYR